MEGSLSLWLFVLVGYKPKKSLFVMNVPFTTNKRYLGTDIRLLEEATLGELEMIDLASQKWYAFHDSESGNPFYLDAFSL